MSIPESLIDKSALTPSQIESIASYLQVKAGRMKLREAAVMQSRRRKRQSAKPVSLGSYYRTVSQAKDNVRKSMATILIALWLGLVKLEDVRRLFELASRSPTDLSEEDKGRLADVLEALLTQMTQ